MKTESTLFRARVATERLDSAKQVFDRLGLKPSDAVNMFFAQVALRNDLPFQVTTQPDRVQTDEAQSKAWDDAYGEY